MCSSNKTIFTLHEAESAINRNKKARKRYRREIRFYYCKYCKGWHLTKAELVEETKPVKLIFTNKWNELLK